MPDHEPQDVAEEDRLSGGRAEPRAARNEGTTPRGVDAPHGAGTRDNRVPPSDDAAIASEPMDLQRLPGEGRSAPPGRQRTGDPPAR